MLFCSFQWDVHSFIFVERWSTISDTELKLNTDSELFFAPSFTFQKLEISYMLQVMNGIRGIQCAEIQKWWKKYLCTKPNCHLEWNIGILSANQYLLLSIETLNDVQYLQFYTNISCWINCWLAPRNTDNSYRLSHQSNYIVFDLNCVCAVFNVSSFKWYLWLGYLG